MALHSHHRITRPATAVVVAVILLANLGSTAAAGGWAVGSIDAVPDATAGETALVGFTILQHGITPVELVDDVGVEIVLDDGTVEFFAGASDGAPGHYTAELTFPATSGQYSWNLRMGWFGVQNLGAIDVSSANRPADTTASVWSSARSVTLALTVLLAAVAVSDLMLARRRTQVAPT